MLQAVSPFARIARSGVARVVPLVFLISALIGCASHPPVEGVFVGPAASDAPQREFRIIDPDESKAPDPAAPKAPRKYDTFAHRVLDIDAGEAPVAAARYALLDSIIDDAKRRVGGDVASKPVEAQRRDAERVLGAIDDALIDHNFLYPPDDYDVDSLRAALAPQRLDGETLERALRLNENTRREKHARAHAGGPFFVADCDTTSILYVGIAEAIGVDLHLVDLPEHMFVRWEFADGGKLNWETNEGIAVPDEDYAVEHHLGRRLRRDRVYLASMTAKEAEGFAYFLRGCRFEARGQDAQAIADLEKARELYPQSTQAKGELAWLYATAAGVDVGKRKAAIGLAKAAVDLEPQCGDFWNSLAAAYAANGDFRRATRSEERAEDFAETEEDAADYHARRKAYQRGEIPRVPRTPDTPNAAE
jgi:tetratricopeptide (TPR) repeat protein